MRFSRKNNVSKHILKLFGQKMKKCKETIDKYVENVFWKSFEDKKEKMTPSCFYL